MITEITQSLLNQMAKCPYQVYLAHIKGIHIPPGIAARKGSGTHKGAEIIHRAKVESGEDVPVDVATDAARDEFVRLVMEEGVYMTPDERAEKNRLLNDGLNGVVSNVRAYRKHISPAMHEIALVEERLYADVGAGMPVSGKPDLVANKTLIDIKTSAKRWTEGNEHIQLQPTIYNILLEQNGFDELGSAYVILSNMKYAPKENGCIYDEENHVCLDIRHTSRTKDDKDKAKMRIKAVVNMIKKGDFPPGPPDQWWCSPKFCGYHGTCCKYV